MRADGSLVESFSASSSGRLNVSEKTLLIAPENDLWRDMTYYVLIDSTVIIGSSGAPFPGITAAGVWSFSIPEYPTMKVGNSAQAYGTTISDFTVPSESGGKLIVTASWELGDSNPPMVTWKGSQAFTVAARAPFGRHAIILYLDQPAAGTGDIVFTFPTSTGARISALYVSRAKSGVTSVSSGTGSARNITSSDPNSLVVGAYTINGSPSITGPLAQALYNGDSGSSTGNAGFQVEELTGEHSYTWSVANSSQDASAIAVFAPLQPAQPAIVTLDPSNPTEMDFVTVADQKYFRLSFSRDPDEPIAMIEGFSSGDLVTWSSDSTVVEVDTPLLFRVRDSVPYKAGVSRFMKLKFTFPE